MNYPKIAAAVYQMCAAYDAYMPELNPDTARAWGAAFEAHMLESPDLEAAVKKIFTERTTTERGDRYRVAVADIVATARKIRQERADREGDTERNRRAELRDAAREHLLYEQEPHPAIEPTKWTPDMVVAAPQYIDCGQCFAKAGLRCRRPDGSTMDGFHQPRLTAAADKAAEKRRALAPPDPKTLFCGICSAHPGEPCTTGGMQMRDVHPERRPA